MFGVGAAQGQHDLRARLDRPHGIQDEIEKGAGEGRAVEQHALAVGFELPVDGEPPVLDRDGQHVDGVFDEFVQPDRFDGAFAQQREFAELLRLAVKLVHVFQNDVHALNRIGRNGGFLHDVGGGPDGGQGLNEVAGHLDADIAKARMMGDVKQEFGLFPFKDQEAGAGVQEFAVALEMSERRFGKEADDVPHGVLLLLGEDEGTEAGAGEIGGPFEPALEEEFGFGLDQQGAGFFQVERRAGLDVGRFLLAAPVLADQAFRGDVADHHRAQRNVFAQLGKQPAQQRLLAEVPRGKPAQAEQGLQPGVAAFARGRILPDVFGGFFHAGAELFAFLEQQFEKLSAFAHYGMVRQGPCQGGLQCGGVDRLDQVVKGAFAHGVDDGFGLPRPGQDDRHEAGVGLGKLTDKGQTIAVGQTQVDERAGEPVLFKEGSALGNRPARDALVLPFPQDFLEKRHLSGLILDDENPRFLCPV